MVAITADSCSHTDSFSQLLTVSESCSQLLAASHGFTYAPDLSRRRTFQSGDMHSKVHRLRRVLQGRRQLHRQAPERRICMQRPRDLQQRHRRNRALHLRRRWILGRRLRPLQRLGGLVRTCWRAVLSGVPEMPLRRHAKRGGLQRRGEKQTKEARTHLL